MTNRGISLVEVLVAGVIASVIAFGNLHSLKFAMQAGTVSRSILTENDFSSTVNKALTEDCKSNLDISETNKQLKTKDVIVPVEAVKLKTNLDPNSAPVTVIEEGTFKEDIEVVKMEVKTKGENDIREREGEFVIYYKKKNLGDLNTVAKMRCEKTSETSYDLSGCFRKKCNLKYTVDDSATTEDNEFNCEVIDCHGLNLQPQVALSGYPCPWGSLYNPDHDKPGNTKPKCDNREKKKGSCENPTGSIFLGGGDSETRREEKPSGSGKCVCEGGRKPTIDGLCIKENQGYNSMHCWPRGDLARNNTGATQTAIKKFCSKEYQGTEFCLRTGPVIITASDDICFTRFSPNDTYFKWIRGDGDGIGGNVKKEKYYKRVYNRETGDVSCISYDRCLYKQNAKEHTSPPPDPSWLMPQTK